MIIMDTDVVSELMRATPNPAVAAWAVDAGPELCVTALTVAEIRYGIPRLSEEQRKQDVTVAANRLLSAFAQ